MLNMWLRWLWFHCSDLVRLLQLYFVYWLVYKTTHQYNSHGIQFRELYTIETKLSDQILFVFPDCGRYRLQSAPARCEKMNKWCEDNHQVYNIGSPNLCQCINQVCIIQLHIHVSGTGVWRYWNHNIVTFLIRFSTFWINFD